MPTPTPRSPLRLPAERRRQGPQLESRAVPGENLQCGPTAPPPWAHVSRHADALRRPAPSHSLPPAPHSRVFGPVRPTSARSCPVLQRISPSRHRAEELSARAYNRGMPVRGGGCCRGAQAKCVAGSRRVWIVPVRKREREGEGERDGGSDRVREKERKRGRQTERGRERERESERESLRKRESESLRVRLPHAQTPPLCLRRGGRRWGYTQSGRPRIPASPGPVGDSETAYTWAR